jgi:hypothetical protein
MHRTSLTLVVLAFASAARAGTNEDLAFFEAKIRPVLVEHCYGCHSAQAKKPKGKLLLDSRDGLRKGGETGPALVPGDPDKSLLIRAVRHIDEALKMPPDKKLPAAVIADLETWIRRGAADPRGKAAVVAAPTWEAVYKERKQWWSLQPVRKPELPTVKNAQWSAQAIDRFILARVEAAGLTPARDADPRTIIRRLSLVLTGLPPTESEVEDFVTAWGRAATPQAAQGAVEQAVDRLLASPHFGERWARHWLDVVRFTETHGNEWNYEVHHAWRYRDYLIRAFNADVPYDQLVREHIAGDLLATPRWNNDEHFNESVIGTAFYRFGEVNHDDCIDLRQIGYDIVDNQIDTLTKAFQATTVACARCHDHKLDAVSMRDYYGLLGILRSSRCVSHTIDAPDVNAAIQDRMRTTKAAIRTEVANAWLKEIGMDRLAKKLAAVTDDKLPMENPLSVWRQTVREGGDKTGVSEALKKVSERYTQEAAERAKPNDASVIADFRTGGWPDWHVGGQGLRGTPSHSGEFTVSSETRQALGAILPAGAYTHALSEKLNGTLRSPVLRGGKKYISFQVLGERASAVRLVSNNCQLNYRNFKYLNADRLQWITFPLPAESDGLRVYAELMTKFDNPKFPDQLGQLGGDKKDYRMPWEKAAADPRSHFGVTQVVLHDQPTPPKPSLAHLACLFEGPLPSSLADLASRYAKRVEAAIRTWRDDKASDDDALWLDACVRQGLLGNRPDLTPRLAELIRAYRGLDAKLALPRVVPGMADCGPGFSQAVFTRGDYGRPGEKAPRRFVEVVAPEPIASAGSGRLELANAIASPANPLTARVMVNRVWHHLFGTGIVRTVDDFGHVGERPSHPELLDYLADQFVHDGWSLKRLIRAIVVSRTFRQAHHPTDGDLLTDPENRLLTRYPARRMEAEAIRDALLATSGRLDHTLYGPSIAAFRDKEYADRRLFRGPLDGAGRRSIYIKVTLMEPPKFLEVFNFPGSKVTQGRRDVTNTPAQALAMLNDPFLLQQADAWAKRLIDREGDTVPARVTAMLQTALGRSPSAAETDRFTRFVAQAAEAHGVGANEVLASPAVWREVSHAVFNLQEFITTP